MSPEVTAAWIAAGVGVLTVAATAVTQYFSRRATSKDTKQQLEDQHGQQTQAFAEQRAQLDKTLAEQRTRTLNERFATAAEQLGDNKPATVRLAGVYAMAGLADDWKENRQTCVDVLCGYLRMPYEPDPGDTAPGPERLAFQAGREVRHTVIRVITAHLKADMDPAKSWQGLNLDFTGVVFDGGDFSEAKFSGGLVLFKDAKFTGTMNFLHTEFTGGGGVWFGGAEFSGWVNFTKAKFSSGGNVSFNGAVFSSGEVNFDYAVFSGSTVNFRGAVFSGGEVNFAQADWTVPPGFDFPASGGWRDLEHDRDTRETGRHGVLLGSLALPPPGVSLPSKKYPSQTLGCGQIVLDLTARP
jgi:hypothetical protein